MVRNYTPRPEEASRGFEFCNKDSFSLLSDETSGLQEA